MEIKNLLTPQARTSFESVSQGIKRKVKPLSDIGSDFVAQNVEAINPAVQNVAETVNTSFVEPIIQPIQQAQQKTQAIGQLNSLFSEKGINADDIKALAEEEGLDFNEVITTFQNNGIKVEGMNEIVKQSEAKYKEIPEGEDLGFFGGAKELATGAFRAGEQIPSITGNVLDFTTRNITGPAIAGVADFVGADEFADKWRAGAEKFGKGAKDIGEDITMAGMTRGGTKSLTKKQIEMRKLGGQLALTAPIGGEFVAGARGTLGLAGRSGVLGAGFGAAQPIIEEGGDATMGDIVKGGVIGGTMGAVAGPLIGKVIAPGAVGIAKKAGKYGQALIKGGTEGLKKSVGRDIQALRQGPTELVTRHIPKAVVRRDLGFTPTERAKIEKITGTDEAQYILSKGLAGKEKEELAEVFMKQSDDMYNGITSQLSKVDAKVQSPVAKEALMDILDQLESSPKLARSYAKDIEGVKQMLARDEFTLSELNNIRRAYDKVNTGMFTAQGKVRSSLENAVDVKVRQDLSNQLQKEAKKFGIDVKEMNKELRAGLEMKDALLRRLSQEERNNFIGLQDLGVSAILSGGNPLTAVATIAAKKYAEKVAPGLAQKAYNLSNKPNVTRSVNRGNTITPRNKPNGLGLSGTNKPDMVRVPVKKTSSKVTPKGVPKKQK